MSQYFNNQFRRKIWANRDAIGAADLKRLDEQVAKITEYVENTKFEAEDMSDFITKEQLKKKSDKNHIHEELSSYTHKHQYEELDDRPVIIDTADYVDMEMISNYYNSDEMYDRLGVNTQIINCSNIIEYKFYSKKDIDIKVIKVFNDRYDKLPVVQLKLFATIDDTYDRKNVSDKVDAISYDMSNYLGKNEIYDAVTFNDKMNKKIIDSKKFITKEDLKNLEKAADVYTAVEFTEKEATKAPIDHTHEELVPIGEIEKLKDKTTHNHAASGVDFEDGRTLQEKFDDGSLSDGAPAQTRAINLFMDIFKNVGTMKDGDLVQTFGFHKLGAGEGTYLIKNTEPTDIFFDSLNGVEINEISDIKISSNLKARLMSSDGKISLWQLGIKDYNPNIESTRLVQSAINKCGLQKYNLDLTGCKFNARKIIINQGITIDGGGACYIINKWEEPTILIERVPEGKTFTLSNMVIGGTVVDAKASNFKPGKAIGVLVNMIEDLYRVRIEGVNVKDFSYAGLVIKGWDTDVHNNCIIHTMRCYFVNSYIGGLCLGDVGSNAFEQSFFNMCQYGFINSGSVLAMDGCQFTHNVVVGFWNTDEFGTNTKVSRVLNCTSNHNDNCGFYSESEAGIVVQGMQIWYGYVILKGNGAFSNFQYGGGTGTGPDGFQFFIDTEKKWTISGAIGMVGGAKIYLKNPGTLIAEANTRLPVQPYTESMVTKVLAPPVMLEYEKTKTETFSPSRLEYKFNGSYQDDYAYTSFCKIGGDGDVNFTIDGGMHMYLDETILMNREIEVDFDKDTVTYEFESKLLDENGLFRGHIFPTNDKGSVGVFGMTTFNSEIKKVEGTFAILNNGEVYTWGANDKGRLGVGSLTPYIIQPTKCRFPDGIKIVDVRSHREGSVFKDSDGHHWLCGINTYGQTNPVNTVDVSIPVIFREFVDENGNIHSVEKLAHVGDAIFVLTAKGELFIRGKFTKGLGLSVSDYNSTSFVNKTSSMPNGEVVVDIFNANYNIFAVCDSGKIYTWGFRGDSESWTPSAHGQQGIGVTAVSYISTPTEIKFEDGLTYPVSANVVDIKGSKYYSALYYDNGDMYWTGYTGEGDIFKCGQSTGNSGGFFKKSGFDRTSDVVAIGNQHYGVYVDMKSKTLYTAGNNTSGQLMTNGTVAISSYSPIYLDGLLDGEVPISVSTPHENTRYDYERSVYVLTNMNRVIACGDNRNGVLGINDIATSSVLDPTIMDKLPPVFMSYIINEMIVDDPVKDVGTMLSAKAKWKFVYTKSSRRLEVRRNNTLVFTKVLPDRVVTGSKIISKMFNGDFRGEIYNISMDIDTLL